MSNYPEFAHCATTRVAAPARFAFEFLANPVTLSNWSLGCTRLQPTEREGVFTGFSLFDGAQSWCGIDARPELLLIDYRVGAPDRLVPRISLRVIPPEICDLAEGQCYVTLTAWRAASMSEEHWRRLCATHDAEIWLIKAQIEAAQQPTAT